MSIQVRPDFRYELHRDWICGAGTVMFVMMNPSTATASEDDPTIRRCIGFAQRWGFQGLSVGNLYAQRATNPDGLFLVDDPIGPDNDRHLQSMADFARRIVVAWGGIRQPVSDRPRHVLRLLGRSVFCLGQTAFGYPRHPLYVKYNDAAVRFDASRMPR